MLGHLHVDVARSCAEHQASMSPDPCTQVGCVLVREDDGRLVTVARGRNDLAAGVRRLDARLQRPVKYKFMLHAEADAIAWAARQGQATAGCIAVVTKFPCAPCCSLLIQSGISGLVTPRQDSDEQWAADYAVSEAMLLEAGVSLQYT